MAARERETATTTQKGHGRLERRTLTVTGALTQYLDWPGARQAFRLVRERTVRGQTAREVVYGITSLPRERAGAARLLHLTRQHWGIENRLFHVRDATLLTPALPMGQAKVGQAFLPVGDRQECPSHRPF